MRNLWKLMILIVCSTSLFSCFDEDMLDPDTESIEVKPEMIFPVAKVELTLGDLLKDNIGDDQSITTENGIFVLKQTQEKIAEYSVADIITYDQDITIAPINLVVKSGLPNISVPIPDEGLLLGSVEANLALDANEQDVIIQKLRASFKMDLGISPQIFPYKIELIFEKIDGKIDNTSLNKEVIVSRGSACPVIDFTDSEINFLTDDIALKNNLKIKAKITITNDGSDVNLGGFSGFTLNFSLIDFAFSYIQGDFGNIEINIDEDSFDVDMGDLDGLSGKFGFTDPELKLILHNRNMGYNFGLNLNLTAISNDDSEVSINKDPNFKFEVLGPIAEISSSEPMHVNELVYNKDNSEIVDFINTFPFKQIKYSGKFTLNPDKEGRKYPNLTDEFNFLSSDAYMSFDAEIKIPLKFRAEEGISYSYNIEDADLGIGQNDREKIVSAKLLFKSINGWPVGLKFENIIFKDENNIELARMDGAILDVPTVDDDGNVVNGGTVDLVETELSNEVIDILDKVKNVELLIRLDAGKKSDESDAPNGITFTENAKLNLVIGVQAKLDLSLTK